MPIREDKTGRAQPHVINFTTHSFLLSIAETRLLLLVFWEFREFLKKKFFDKR